MELNLCQNSVDDNRIFWLSAFRFQCGQFSKQSPKYGSNRGSLLTTEFIWSSASHFQFSPCSKLIWIESRMFADDQFIWSSVFDFQFGPCGRQPYLHSRTRLSTMFNSNFPCHLFRLLSTSQECVTERFTVNLRYVWRTRTPR